VTGAATDTRDAAGATWHAAWARVLAAGAATDTRDAALAARSAVGAAVHTAGAAVAVGVAAATARVVLEDDVGRRGRSHRRSSTKRIGRCRWRARDSCSDGPSYHQWFHEV
jgi:hypothetical protein